MKRSSSRGQGTIRARRSPEKPGNVAIAGHRTTYAHPFYNLNELGPGDSIYILTEQGFFHYKVATSQVVAPTDVAVLDTVPNQSTLTLTTCNPRYSAATRLVVTADFDPGPGKSVGACAPDHDNRSQGRGADCRHPRRFPHRIEQQHLAGGVVVCVNGSRCRRQSGSSGGVHRGGFGG